MTNLQIAQIFYEIADLLELQGIDWKPNAYRKAARSIEALQQDVSEIYSTKGFKGLLEISGVGEGLGKKIEEFIETGKIREYEKVKSSIPEGVEELMHVQSLGPKKAFRLYNELGIKNVSQLERAAKEGKISILKGFGEKSEKDILEGLDLVRKGKERMLLGNALPIARQLEFYLRKINGVESVQVAGSIRRRKETVKDIDILVIAKNPEKVMNAFSSMPNISKVLAKGETKCSVILKEGLNADVRIVPKKSYGAAMQYFTGNKDHNIIMRQMAIKKGWKLNEYGLFNLKTNKQLAGETEEQVYKKLGLNYIEPELRENTDELKTKLPKLIQYNSIKGDLHLHTNWSDGNNTTEEMVNAAIKLGYEYIAITDHSKSERIANGLDEKRLAKHIEEIELLQKKYPQIKILKGAEVDILRDGELDYADKTLSQLDVVVTSVHSGFKMNKEEMTKRILSALDNPHTTILGHPTGRLINQRNPYEVDMSKVINSAKENNVLLEINSFPSRLDLNDVNIKSAVESGAKLCINTDSHSKEHLNLIEFGIAQARRGWAEEKDVVNTWKWREFERFLTRKK
ncbi:MAG: DNA polymerase/3'-5' exonuclease PolX [Nanoarchaeota archaeon]